MPRRPRVPVLLLTAFLSTLAAPTPGRCGGPAAAKAAAATARPAAAGLPAGLGDTGAVPLAEPPVAISPGHPARLLRVAARCPTFSWGRAAGAERYELVVYRVAEDGETAPVALRAMIDGRAGSWTPPLGRCLERGGRYAWSLRARRGASSSAWSPPALFAVAPGPSAAELEAELATLRAVAGSGRPRSPSAGAAGGEPGAQGDSAARAEPADETSRPRGRGETEKAAETATGDPAILGLSIEGRVEAAAFIGDGSGLSGVEAAGLACAGCVGGGTLAAGAVAAANIGEPCASGQVLMRGAAAWECATVTAPACAPGDEVSCYTGPAGTRGVGACAGGTRLCAADSTWGECAGEVTPTAESCNGLDDSCDGAVDEGDPAALCPPTANVTATLCEAAGCAIAGCDELWADADGDYANGCEAPAPGACLDGGAPRPIAGPGAGELVIQELLADPATPLTDADGEWFEVAVLAEVDLNGVGLGTTFGTVIDEIAADDCLSVEAGQLLLFARSADPAANGGLAPDQPFGFSLVNGGGDLHLAWDGNLVDAVSWSAGEVEAGRARNLPPGFQDATTNDDPANWCTVPGDGTLLYFDGNHGTPGAANVGCP